MTAAKYAAERSKLIGSCCIFPGSCASLACRWSHRGTEVPEQSVVLGPTRILRMSKVLEDLALVSLALR